MEAWLELLKEKETKISKIFAKEYGADKVVDQLNGWKLFYIMSRLVIRKSTYTKSFSVRPSSTTTVMTGVLLIIRSKGTN